MINFQRLKDIREDNDISQEKISKILGVKRSTYSLWELGINIIPLKYLCRFSDYFKVSLDYVLGISKNKNSKNLITGLSITTLGSNMKKVRVKKMLSQENVASMLNITQPAIARYEKGLVTISVSNLYKFSKIFKISISELCGKTKK